MDFTHIKYCYSRTKISFLNSFRQLQAAHAFAKENCVSQNSAKDVS